MTKMAMSFRPHLSSEPSWPRSWEPCWTGEQEHALAHDPLASTFQILGLQSCAPNPAKKKRNKFLDLKSKGAFVVTQNVILSLAPPLP